MRTVYKEGTTLLDYREITPFQGKLKDMDEANYKKLLASFEKHGFFVPMYVWGHEEKNYCLDGHGRIRVLTTEKIEFENTGYQIPVVYLEADNIQDAKEKLLKITSQYQTITYDGLYAYLAEAELPEAEVYEAVHFDALPLLGDKTEEPDTEEDEAPEVDEGGAASSVLGTVYQLGDHLIMCGDSLNTALIEKLMGGKLADMVFTDPPYNTGMTGKSQGGDTLWRGDGKKRSARLSHMFDDSFTEDQWQDFMSSFVSNCAMFSKEDSVAYICLDWRRNYELIPHIKDHYRLSNIIVWDKVVHGLGSDYQYTYELLNVCKKGKPELNTHQGEKEYQDVWHIQRKLGRDEDHATKKPIELCARAIRHASKPGDIVLDIFGGSGSTLIAAEQLGRTCFMSEIDPKYVDVVRKRYHKLINNGDETGWEEGTPARDEVQDAAA